MPEPVYISSTYEDLKIFRQAIINCIVSLSDYYTPVSMEFYDAEDIHFVQKCQRDVEACRVYILILGRRYGYIPKGFDKSITELEYQKAVECRKNGKPIDILVFKAGDFCKNYNYTENNSRFDEYNGAFLEEVGARLSPRPFDSEAELQLQVSHALMKRLFKLIRRGDKVIMPDKDAVLCYCDRKPAITSLKINVLLKHKRIFFVQGNRMTDYPGGVVKRFAKYSMGSFNKIEPLLNITSLATSCDEENSYVSVLYNILEYINRPATEENMEMNGFVKDLALLRSNKVILPFYYDAQFDQGAKSFTDFLCFLDRLFSEYTKEKRGYELYIIVMIYKEQPDYATVRSYLEPHAILKPLAATIDKLSTVTRNDILDWIESFVTGMEQSPSVYKEYFDADENKEYFMQDVNMTLGRIIDDLEKGDEKIKPYL